MHLNWSDILSMVKASPEISHQRLKSFPKWCRHAPCCLYKPCHKSFTFSQKEVLTLLHSTHAYFIPSKYVVLIWNFIAHPHRLYLGSWSWIMFVWCEYRAPQILVRLGVLHFRGDVLPLISVISVWRKRTEIKFCIL